MSWNNLVLARLSGFQKCYMRDFAGIATRQGPNIVGAGGECLNYRPFRLLRKHLEFIQKFIFSTNITIYMQKSFSCNIIKIIKICFNRIFMKKMLKIWNQKIWNTFTKVIIFKFFKKISVNNKRDNQIKQTIMNNNKNNAFNGLSTICNP